MRVIGLMSGTSVDAIDAAVCDIGDDGVPHLVAHSETPWPAELRARILGLLHPHLTSIAEVCAMDAAIGQAFGAAAATLAAEHPPVDLVASHGQTVHHWVADDGVARGTLQLGSAAWIGEATGLPVVSDLRPADIAAGGQGAPLVPVLDVAVYGGPPTAVLNLGGIANVTILVDGRVVVAGDTGPANCLMDAVVERATEGRERYDADGTIAARGSVDASLLNGLRSHPWLRLPMPRSTGREVFSLAWYDQVLDDRPLDLPDQLATLAEFTVSTALDQIRPHAVERVVLAGGGAHNPALRDRFAAAYPTVTSSELGVPSDAKEAMLVALIGWLTWHGRPGVARTADGRPTTGAREARVLGSTTDPRPR